MPDWTKSMEQSYEFYTVEPTTLANLKRLDKMKSASFSRDNDTDTLGSATFDGDQTIGEAYIRGYLKTVQNGVTEKFPLGTALVQTLPSSFNGTVTTVSMDAYTPLIELKENQPPLGYTVRRGTNIMDAAYSIIRENTRVPVNPVAPKLVEKTDLRILKHPRNVVAKASDTVSFTVESAGVGLTYQWSYSQNNVGWYNVTTFDGWNTPTMRVKAEETRNGFLYRCKVTDANGNTVVSQSAVLTIGEETVYGEPAVPDSEREYEDQSPTLQFDFVANTDDTWLSFVRDLILNADYELGLDEMGHILFMPIQDTASLQPVWRFDDGNSSILYPEITMDRDLYGIPNVVKVVYFYGDSCKEAVVENNDPNSPVSTVTRGRKITYVDSQPSLAGYVTQGQVEEYAKRLLKAVSTIEYKVSYTHGYCPVRVGDCVLLNYEKAGIHNIKAKVISQNIECGVPCSVSETAVFTNYLWR